MKNQAPLPNVQEIIRLLDLHPHPEGGFYRETFRDELSADGRARSTLIYFLLPAGQISAWHRVDAADTWHFYAGAPLRLRIRAPEPQDQRLQLFELGSDLLAGQRPQCVVPAWHWQTAESLAAHESEWSLVGCSVAPGFEFAGFEIAPIGFRPQG